MQYQPVIGLEVHIQSKTQSKMFCMCPAKYFGAEPNTQTCPTCLGLPGALPTINKKALDQCIKLSLALHCQINKFTKFDRKNYFYPDLPKGYQISQYDLPVGHSGYLEIDGEKDARRVRITRVHQEEDTGKSIQENGKVLLDFNKSGVPLIEVVTEPDFTSVEEVTEFAKELKRIVKYTDVSDANMQMGQMRFELNISLKKAGDADLPDYKVEIKNIGSISVLEKVIDFEIKRQSKLLDAGKKPQQETRGLKDMSGKTVSQRVKEGSSDYRYFPEPDLPPVKIDQDWIQAVSKKIPELPREKRLRFVRDYGLAYETARTITNNKTRANWFESACRHVDTDEFKKLAREVGNWFIGDLLRLIKKEKIKFNKLRLQPEHLVELATLHSSDKISGTVAKKVLEESFKTGESPKEIVEKKGLKQMSDTSSVEKVVQKVIKDNPDVVENVQKNPNAVQYLVGQVMKETRGKANPQVAEKLLKEKLLQ